MINHYDILEVNKQATSKEIQFAYERMKTLNNGTMWHPDWNGNSNAYKTMRQIHEAHKVLSDKVLREQYDAELLAAEKLATELAVSEKLKLIQEQQAAVASRIPPTPVYKPITPTPIPPTEPAPPPQIHIEKKSHWLKRWFNKWIGKP